MDQVRPDEEIPDRCAKCGTSKKEFQTHTSFGGYYRITCISCGEIVASGRKSPVEF